MAVSGNRNGVLLLNRVTPFTGPDVKNLITDGLRIAKKYLTYTQMTIGAVLLRNCGSNPSDHPDKGRRNTEES